MRALFFSIMIIFLPTYCAANNVALVIGNSAYESVEPLTNPANDAAAIATALQIHGFEVTLAGDMSRANMLNTLRAFRDKADRAEFAIVYYAGHGMEISGRNYLVPVDARINDERDARLEMIELQDVLAQLSGARRMKMVVLDACRDNPFVNKMKRENKGRNVGRGLALVTDAGADTLIAYAAAAGDITPDGVAGQNSPFTQAFLNALTGPPADIRLLLGAVRDELRQSVPGAAPFVYSSLGGGTYILNRNSRPVAASPPTESFNANAMLTDFATAEIADSLDVWEGFLNKYQAQSDHTLYVLARRNRDLRMAAVDPEVTGQTPLSRAPNSDTETLDSSDPTLQAPVQEPVLSTPLIYPTRKEAVLEIQRLLKGRNCYPGRLDGLYGRQTASGLETLSKRANVPLNMNKDTKVDELAVLIERLEIIDDATCPAVKVVRKPKAKAPVQSPSVAAREPAKTTIEPVVVAPKKEKKSDQSVFRNPPNTCPQFGASPGCRDGDRIDN